MVYDSTTRGDGEWHCPFSRDWVERMRKAAKRCEKLTNKQVEAAYERLDSGFYYELPAIDFMCEPKDSRGLPFSYSQCRDVPTCSATYDYSSIPDVVISNGHDDWPLRMWEYKI